jgi:hypothetical protein
MAPASNPNEVLTPDDTLAPFLAACAACSTAACAGTLPGATTGVATPPTAPLDTWPRQLLPAAWTSHFASCVTASAVTVPLCSSCRPRVVWHWVRTLLTALLLETARAERGCPLIFTPAASRPTTRATPTPQMQELQKLGLSRVATAAAKAAATPVQPGRDERDCAMPAARCETWGLQPSPMLSIEFVSQPEESNLYTTLKWCAAACLSALCPLSVCVVPTLFWSA